MKKIWFKGSDSIDCEFKRLVQAIENHGKFYEGVVGFMPGISHAELLEQGIDFLIIKTNEGIMKRTNMKKIITKDAISVEFDEEYRAGKMITTSTHFFDEFTSMRNGMIHKSTISDVKATGILGFFYTKFGGNKIGNAILKSHKIYLEAKAE